MVTRVDPFLGGLGIDATGKFEVASNATVTVGDGTSTGNVNVGGEVVSSTVDAATLKIGGTAIIATAAELNYVDGVTSAIQTQLDAKAPTAGPTFTGTLTYATLNDGTTALTSTVAELNYTDGVTSNIQTQLDGKQASGSYLTGNQTITLSGDASGSGTTAITVTVADDSHNHIISNVDGLQAALDAKLPLAGGTMTGIIAGFESTGIDDNATSTAITIDSSENVGIGTAAPVAKIDITQNQAALSYLLDTNNVTNGGSSIWRMVTRNIANSGTTSVDFYKPTGSGFSLLNNDTHASNFTAFGVGGSERMRIDSSGNVGIGTTAPSSMLEISSAGDNTNVIVMSQGGNYKNSIQNLHSGSASNARMSFFVHDSSTTQANVMSLLGNGNVGIGTVSPGTALEVNGTVNASNGKLQEGGNSLIPPGSIIMYGAAAAPGGWYLCEGGAISRSTYAALFSAIGTTYGVGDGSTTFNVPDFRDRAPYGASTFLLGSKTAGEVDVNGQNSTGTGTSGSTGGSTVANTTGADGPTTHSVTTSTTNSTTDKDVTNSITVVTGVSAHATHTHSIPSLTVNGHTHSVPALTVTHPGVAVKFIIKT